MKTDFLTRLQHLQFRLLHKGVILVRNCEEDEFTWFVNCFVWKDYEKYLQKEEIGSRSDDNKISIYRNHVTNLDEAIDNCIKLLDYYEQNSIKL